MLDNCILADLARYIGQTVTVFTTSGGLSGSGFTGVLAGVGDKTIKLITDIATYAPILRPHHVHTNAPYSADTA